MARAIWTGALSFGLVNIPVGVHPAVRDHRPRFRMLHANDRSPIKPERVCQKDGHAVAWKELVKGYEFEKGHFVVLTKEDFAAAALEKTRRIDILDFVDSGTIDDRFFETPYYLTPGKGGELAYTLLRQALRETGRSGIAKFILRDVQHLAAVEVIENALTLSTLRFADELVDAASLDFPDRVTFKKQELDLAKSLVQSLAGDWQPEKYTDDYRDNLMKVIEAKIKGKTADLVPEAPARDSNVVDLMERLRRSLEGSAGRAAAGRGRHEGSEKSPRKSRTRKAGSGTRQARRVA